MRRTTYHFCEAFNLALERLRKKKEARLTCGIPFSAFPAKPKTVSGYEKWFLMV